MSDDRRREHLALERRLRSILRTIVNQGEVLTESHELELEADIIGRVVDSIGAEGMSWQSHELIEQLQACCLQSGDSQWECYFDDLLSWPLEDGVSDYSMQRAASRVAQLGGPRALEASVANAFLRYRWPSNDSLVPSVPFRFLHRRIEVESIFGRIESVDQIGDRVLREVEWVTGSVVVSGAFDGIQHLPEQVVQERWIRLRSRIRGFIEALQQPPEVVWEIAAIPRPEAGQLFPDPQQLDRQQRFIRRCFEELQPVPLRITVPLPIPPSTRQLLSRCLRTKVSARISWDQKPDLPIVAGRLQRLPSQGIRAICQRMMAFDRIVSDGLAPCWQGDWTRARQQFRPLWIASEKTIPPLCVDYLHRNSEELHPFPVIAIETFSVEKCKKDAEKLLQKISRRRGGGWDRFEELLRGAAISPRLLAPATDRA